MREDVGENVVMFSAIGLILCPIVIGTGLYVTIGSVSNNPILGVATMLIGLSMLAGIVLANRL